MCPAVDPLALLLGQILAIVNEPPPTGGKDAVSAVLMMLNAVAVLIMQHLANPSRALGYTNASDDPRGVVVSLVLETAEATGAAEEPEADEPKGLSGAHEELAYNLLFVLEDLGDFHELLPRLRSALAEPNKTSREVLTNMRLDALAESLRSLTTNLKGMSTRLSGVGDDASLATHAARLARVVAYTDTEEQRSMFAREAIDAFERDVFER